MFAAAEAAGVPAIIDWRGCWYTADTVYIQAPARSEISGGSISVLADLAIAVEVNLGSVCELGLIRVSGRATSFVGNRNVGDGIGLLNLNNAVCRGFVVRFTRRNGVVTLRGGNIIGAVLGAVRASSCGAPGVLGAPSYTRVSGTVTEITREGSASSYSQRALLTHTAMAIEAGDWLVIADGEGNRTWCWVDSIDVDGTRVYPWPGALWGTGAWAVEAVVGAALRLTGGNTTQVVVSSVIGQYVGHGLQVESLYGGVCMSIMAELAGSALTVGNPNVSVQSLAVGGLHSEATVTDVVHATQSLFHGVVIAPIQDLIVDGSVVDDNVVHVRPTKGSGTPLDQPFRLRQLS
jgi:hypothetical protein